MNFLSQRRATVPSLVYIGSIPPPPPKATERWLWANSVNGELGGGIQLEEALTGSTAFVVYVLKCTALLNYKR